MLTNASPVAFIGFQLWLSHSTMIDVHMETVILSKNQILEYAVLIYKFRLARLKQM